MIRGEFWSYVNGTSIMIRSTTTLNGSTEPLFVVDESRIYNRYIQPLDVRSISILKGSSAAIYAQEVPWSNNINLLHGDDK